MLEIKLEIGMHKMDIFSLTLSLRWPVSTYGVPYWDHCPEKAQQRRATIFSACETENIKDNGPISETPKIRLLQKEGTRLVTLQCCYNIAAGSLPCSTWVWCSMANLFPMLRRPDILTLLRNS